MSIPLLESKMGEILHRKANKMRHGHRHAPLDRRLHGLGPTSAAPAVRDHHPELEQARHWQSRGIFL